MPRCYRKDEDDLFGLTNFLDELGKKFQEHIAKKECCWKKPQKAKLAKQPKHEGPPKNPFIEKLRARMDCGGPPSEKSWQEKEIDAEIERRWKANQRSHGKELEK